VRTQLHARIAAILALFGDSTQAAHEAPHAGVAVHARSTVCSIDSFESANVLAKLARWALAWWVFCAF